MHQLVFENADGILSAGKVGASKVIRIFRTQTATKGNEKDALRAALCRDIQFITKHQGEIEKFDCKSNRGLGNSIIIAKHKNKTLSHIAVNFYDDPAISETFRLEVAGQDGLIEYDSDKSRPVIFNKCAGEAMLEKSDAAEKDVDPQTMQVVDAIVNRLEGKV